MVTKFIDDDHGGQVREAQIFALPPSELGKQLTILFFLSLIWVFAEDKQRNHCGSTCQFDLYGARWQSITIARMASQRSAN